MAAELVVWLSRVLAGKMRNIAGNLFFRLAQKVLHPKAV
jgi:hypothetical protein